MTEWECIGWSDWYFSVEKFKMNEWEEEHTHIYCVCVCAASVERVHRDWFIKQPPDNEQLTPLGNDMGGGKQPKQATVASPQCCFFLHPKWFFPSSFGWLVSPSPSIHSRHSLSQSQYQANNQNAPKSAINFTFSPLKIAASMEGAREEWKTPRFFFVFPNFFHYPSTKALSSGKSDNYHQGGGGGGLRTHPTIERWWHGKRGINKCLLYTQSTTTMVCVCVCTCQSAIVPSCLVWFGFSQGCLLCFVGSSADANTYPYYNKMVAVLCVFLLFLLLHFSSPISFFIPKY